MLVDIKKLDDLPDDQVVLICTGSQGEPMAALSRMANRDHKIEVGQGDTVMLASSLIPGNENAVYRVINGLMHLGADVVHKGNAKVHVSGHASAGELLYCYNIVKPRNVMPVHGEWRHLVANGDLAVATGVPRDRVVLAEDGVVVDLVDGRATIAGAVPCGYVYVDGSSVGGTTEALLKDRRILRDEGFISVIVVVDSATGKVARGPGDPRARLRRGGRRSSTRSGRGSSTRSTTPPPGGHRRLRAAAGHPPLGRQLGRGQAAPPSDDHPDGHRGLTGPLSRHGGGPVPAAPGRASRWRFRQYRAPTTRSASPSRTASSCSVSRRSRAATFCSSHRTRLVPGIGTTGTPSRAPWPCTQASATWAGVTPRWGGHLARPRRRSPGSAPGRR